MRAINAIIVSLIEHKFYIRKGATVLDMRGLARITRNVARVRAGRTRLVTLIYRRPQGDAYVTAAALWREQEGSAHAGGGGGGGHVYAAGPRSPLVLAEFTGGFDPASVALVADTPGGTREAAADAALYEVASFRFMGIAANRLLLELRRLR